MTRWGDRVAHSFKEGLSSVMVAAALAGLIVLGVLAVLIVTVRAAQTTYRAAAMSVSVAEVTERAIATTTALQEERALGSIMSHSALSRYHPSYQDSISRTDEAIQDLRVSWSQHRSQVPETATPPISDVLAAEVSLVDFREATLTPSGETTYPLYSEIVGLSLAATVDLVKQTEDPGVDDWALIGSLLTASEALHNQRYLIQEALVPGGQMSEEARLQLDVVTSNLNQSLFQARSVAEDDDLLAVEEIITGEPAQEAEGLLASITADDADSSLSGPEEWFEVSSARIAQIADLVPTVHAEVAAVAQGALDDAERALWTRSILLGALFILSILVASNAVYATRERGEALAEYGQLADGLRQWFVAASFPDAENVEIAARYVPASVRTMSGGDWYDVYEVGEKLAVVIGDIAGHGAEATAQMAQVRNILRGQSTARTLGPAEQVDLLSRSIGDSEIVATLTYGLLDPRSGRFVYTRAGHIPLLIRSGSGEVRIEEEAPGPPIGAGVAIEREQKMTQLLAGDVLILITDGLVEGVDRDIDLALDQIAKSLTEVEHSSEAILDELFAMNEGTPLDDAAALLITWKPLQPQVV
ncbi:MAG TPA: SpoIIE family protein phosphatase [Acidimicrobiia bacterium]|nr:SpoIIE family protein phosphatase [Acidimicrobiia bacterium]